MTFLLMCNINTERPFEIKNLGHGEAEELKAPLHCRWIKLEKHPQHFTGKQTATIEESLMLG